ncbi:MAG: MFS transporter [Chloroflexota bacterium]
MVVAAPAGDSDELVANLLAPGTPSGSDYAPMPVARRPLFSSGSLGSGMFNGFFNTALPLFLGHYTLPLWAVGLLAQERSILGSIFEPVIGALSDRARTRLGRRRPFMLVGIPLTVLVLLILSSRPAVEVVVGILLFLPFCLAIANVPYRAMLADVVAPAQRGGLGGMMSLMEMVGQVSITVFAIYLWTTHETWAFMVIAAGLLVGFGLVFFSTKEPPLPPLPMGKGTSVDSGALAVASAPARLVAAVAKGIAYLRDVLSYGEAAKYVACQFVFWFGVGGVTPFLTRYAVYELGFSEGTAFSLFLILIALTAVFSIPAGILGDRIGKKRVLCFGLLLFATGALVGSLVNTVVELGAVLAIIGFANAITTALGFPLLTELLPRRRMGELTGIGGMTWSLAQPLGSLSAGFVADSTGTMRTVFLLAAATLVVSLLILLWVRAPRVAVEPPAGRKAA